MSIRKFAFFVLILLLPVHVFSQVPKETFDTLSKNRINTEGRQMQEINVEFDPSPVQNINSFLTFGNFLSTVSNQKVEANIGFIFWDYNFGLGLSSPVSKEEKESKPLTITDGLSKSVNASLSITKFFWNPKLDVLEFGKVQNIVKEELKSLIAFDSLGVIDISKFKNVLEQFYLSEDIIFNEKFGNQLTDIEKLKKTLQIEWLEAKRQSKDLKLEIEKFVATNFYNTFNVESDSVVIIDSLGVVDLSRLMFLLEKDEIILFNQKYQNSLTSIKKFRNTIDSARTVSESLKKQIENFINTKVTPTWSTMSEKQRNFLSEVKAVKWEFPAYLLGFQTKVGRVDFNYAIDSNSISDIKKSNETNWSLTGGFGLAFSQNSVLSFNVSYSVNFKGKEESDHQILNPINGLISTKKFAFGAPSRNEDYKVSLSYKWLITKAFGISPSFTGSFNEKKVGIDFPIYFFQLFEKGKDGNNVYKGLNGGIFFSWVSPAEKLSYLELNEDNINAGIFIGATLDPLNSLFK